jgi:hypothetical protein
MNMLMPTSFDGYVEKSAKVSSTLLVPTLQRGNEVSYQINSYKRILDVRYSRFRC